MAWAMLRDSYSVCPDSSGASHHQCVEGRFFFINNVLCKTADESGAFCPRDVFNGLALVAPVHDSVGKEQQSTGFSLPRPAWTSQSANGTARDGNVLQGVPNDFLPCAGGSATMGSNNGDGYEVDCHVFNTFGVLSGGVLMDLSMRRFVDAIDARPFTPQLPHEGASSGNGSGSACDTASHPTIVQQNHSAYRRGHFDQIRAESVLTFCSSMEPYNHPGTEATPVRPPANPRITNSAAVQQAKRNVARVVRRLYRPDVMCDSDTPKSSHHSSPRKADTRCVGAGGTVEGSRDTRSTNKATPRSEKAEAYARFMHIWNVSEAYRLIGHATESTSTYLPARIPFRFRYAGHVLARSRGTMSSGSSHLQQQVHTDYILHSLNRDTNADDVSSGVHPAQPTSLSVLSPSHMPAPDSTLSCCFTCYTGRPSMVKGVYVTPRHDLSTRVDTTRLQQMISSLLQPWTPHRVDGQTELASSGARCGESQSALEACVAPDSEAFYLTPYISTSPYERAWWVFRTYFTYLGIVQVTRPASRDDKHNLPDVCMRGQSNSNGSRATMYLAQGLLLSSSSVLKEADMTDSTAFTLCPDREYSVSQQVRRKRKHELHRRRVRETMLGRRRCVHVVAPGETTLEGGIEGENDGYAKDSIEPRVPVQTVARVWDALMQSVPRQLMRRLRRVERFLTKLQQRHQSARKELLYR